MTIRNTSEACTTDNFSAVGPKFVSFGCVDEMEESIRSIGWDISFRQLQAGKLVARSNSQKIADVTIMERLISRRFEAAGDSPGGHIVVLVPVGDDEFWINGFKFGNGGILILPPNSELHACSPEQSHLLTLHLPVVKLRELGYARFNCWESLTKGAPQYIKPEAWTHHRLVQEMLAALRSSASIPGDSYCTNRLVDRLHQAINFSNQKTTQDEGDTRSNTRRVISDARDFIEQNMTNTMSVMDVCDSVSTSLSKLERAFRNELNVSPCQYILARRLNVVHKELRRRSLDISCIARVAMDNGFSHLGRFSGAYRVQFGELPSETLRRP